MSHRLRCLIACLVLVLNVRAQDPGTVRDLIALDLGQLARVPIVSASRREQPIEDAPRFVSVITAEEIRRRNYRNVPEALTELAGVFVQQTNYGGGSPIIRGMVGNRILILLNGIRLNNSRYRLGPNQYLNSIDINSVERIEVVRGPGSALYGSDALGGSINVITRSPGLANSKTDSEPKLHARTFVRGASADRSGSGRAEVGWRSDSAGLLGGYSRKGFGDLHAGAGVQKYTGYEEWAGDFIFELGLRDQEFLTAGMQRLVQDDVWRGDAVAGSDLKYAWEPQGRDLAWVKYSTKRDKGWVRGIEATTSFSSQYEKLNRVTRTRPDIERNHTDITDTLHASLELRSDLTDRHLLVYGVEAFHDRTTSRRVDTSLVDGSATRANGTYPDGAAYSTTAAFLQDEVRITSKLNATVGLRFDQFHLNAVGTDRTIGEFAAKGSPSALTGSAYLLYKLHTNFDVTGGVAQGFRAPNVDDSTVVDGSSSVRYEVPNPNLLPEETTNYETGVRWKIRSASVKTSYYIARYRNLIERGPGHLLGKSYVDLNDNGQRDAIEPAVFQRLNIGRALVQGVESEVALRLSERWSAAAGLSWTRGVDTVVDQPLTRIPPTSGMARVTWTARKGLWLEAAAIGAARQSRLSPSDLVDRRINPNGTPGFLVLHVRAGIQVGMLGDLTLGLENLTNRTYRHHGSGIDRPGTNLVLGFNRMF